MRRQICNDGDIRVIQVLRQYPVISLEDLALTTNYARCTVHLIVTRLVYHGYVEKHQGRGRIPNRYVVAQDL